MSETIIQQGRFTSTGALKTLQLRSGIDWMRVYNTDVASDAQTTAIGVEYYWQRGFPDGAKWEYKKSSAANAADLSVYTTTGGFTYIDTTGNPNGVIHAVGSATEITAISTANPPVATNSGVNGLSAGNVVRLINVSGAPQIGGMDFTVGYGTLSDTTFSLDYMSVLGVAGTTAGWIKINWNPIFYPRYRYITKISNATQAVVTLSVTHGYLVGQRVRMQVPAAYGMSQMNGLSGTIVSIDTTTTVNTITLDIDASAFDAFAFPAAAAVPFVKAMVIPEGEDTAQAISSAVDRYNDAEENQGYIGMSLAAGANGPAGQSNDVIYWVAGVSFSVDNQ